MKPLMLVFLVASLSMCSCSKPSRGSDASALAEMQRERLQEAARIQSLIDGSVYKVSVDRDVLTIVSDLNMDYNTVLSGVCNKDMGLRQQLFGHMQYVNKLEFGVTQTWDVPLPVRCSAIK